jgi:hypothetical protein
MFGQVQLLLQLSIDRLADETEPIELLLVFWRAVRLLVGLGQGFGVYPKVLMN